MERLCGGATHLLYVVELGEREGEGGVLFKAAQGMLTLSPY